MFLGAVDDGAMGFGRCSAGSILRAVVAAVSTGSRSGSGCGLEFAGAYEGGGSSVVGSSVGAAGVGEPAIPRLAELEGRLCEGLASASVPAERGHPFVFGAPPVPQLAFEGVAASAGVEDSFDTESSGGSVEDTAAAAAPPVDGSSDEAGLEQAFGIR